MKRSSSKLALHRDTLRNLAPADLRGAAGDGTLSLTPTIICSGRYTCAYNCTVGCPTGGNCTVLC